MSFVQPDLEPTPFRRALRGMGIWSSVLVGHWRAVVLVFLLVLTVWLGIQVVSVARIAFVFLHDNLQLNERYKQFLPISPRPPAGAPTGAATPASPPEVRPRTTICWRDRSLGSDCFKPREPRHPAPRSSAPRPLYR
jgi:hypothetical protein